MIGYVGYLHGFSREKSHNKNQLEIATREHGKKAIAARTPITAALITLCAMEACAWAYARRAARMLAAAYAGRALHHCQQIRRICEGR
ncbi:MAG: hypothetical protein IPP88_21975 [Betaproteobacteria bacterium]|nr:hypothetical protein [Betaproteobacteria bacterium]